MSYILLRGTIFRDNDKDAEGKEKGGPPRSSPPPAREQSTQRSSPPQAGEQSTQEMPQMSDNSTESDELVLSSSPPETSDTVEGSSSDCEKDLEHESELAQSQSSGVSSEETESLEAKYYHIDTLLNKVMRLKFEINQTSLKRQETNRKLEKAKERLHFLNRPNPGSLLLVEAFHKETLENYRRLLSRIKAIDESLLNLQRQYDDTLSQAENEQKLFLASRQSDSEPLPEVEISIQSELQTCDASKYSTFEPSQLLSRDKWTDIGDKSISTESAHGVLLDILEEDKTMSAFDEKQLEARLFEWTECFEMEIAQTILDQCSRDKCLVCGVTHKSVEMAIAHYNGKRHKKAIQKLLNLKTENKYLYIAPVKNHQDSYKRLSVLDNKEAEMRDIWENYSSVEFREDKPWLTDEVIKFVSQSVEDFQTLLKWLEDLQTEEKWNNLKINDITYGLGELCLFLYSLLKTNFIFRKNSL